MTTPNITPAQIIGLVTALGGVAVAYGLLDGAQERVVVAATVAAVGIGLKLADAIIRHGRSRALHGVQAAAITAEATQPWPATSSRSNEPTVTTDNPSPPATPTG